MKASCHFMIHIYLDLVADKLLKDKQAEFLNVASLNNKLCNVTSEGNHFEHAKVTLHGEQLLLIKLYLSD